MIQSTISFLKKYIPILLLLVLTFYVIYPQALDVRGSSFILGSGVVGAIVYALHKFPFKYEVMWVMIFLFAYIGVAMYSGMINNIPDAQYLPFFKSQMGWFFSAYLIVYLLYRIHKRPTINLLITYIIAAVTLQCIITVIMYFNEDVNQFLYSIQLQASLFEEDRVRFQTERLVGYGTYLFGTGIIAGYSLILCGYLLMAQKMTTFKLIIASLSYVLIFYVGLFSARTTAIGLFFSIGLLVFFYIFGKSSNKKQVLKTAGYITGLMILGISITFIYFTQFTDWAFEMFYSMINRGDLYTDSSNALLFNIYGPADFKEFMIGSGSIEFGGNDVGFTRLMFFVGIIGSILYFAYTLSFIYFSWTKDKALNILLITLFGFNIVMNIKGFTDINHIFYLFFFYFMFYKYYYYYPTLSDPKNNSINNIQQ